MCRCLCRLFHVIGQDMPGGTFSNHPLVIIATAKVIRRYCFFLAVRDDEVAALLRQTDPELPGGSPGAGLQEGQQGKNLEGVVGYLLRVIKVRF